MKQSVQNWLLDLGVIVGKSTAPEDVIQLIQQLKPRPGKQELIRIGASGDGGYLIPNDFEGIDYCFSPGVDDIAQFELDLVKRGIKCFQADYSVKIPPVKHDMIEFDAHFIGAVDNDQSVTLDSWINSKLPKDYTGDLILQMDIEGYEYETILALSDSRLQQFRLLVIEFHHLHKLFDPTVLPLYRSCFSKLMKYFDVVHLHPNNLTGMDTMRNIQIPRLMEFTLARRDAVLENQVTTRFPHPLDRDCDPSRPSLPLPACWYHTTAATT